MPPAVVYPPNSLVFPYEPEDETDRADEERGDEADDRHHVPFRLWPVCFARILPIQTGNSSSNWSSYFSQQVLAMDIAYMRSRYVYAP